MIQTKKSSFCGHGTTVVANLMWIEGLKAPLYNAIKWGETLDVRIDDGVGIDPGLGIVSELVGEEDTRMRGVLARAPGVDTKVSFTCGAEG